ncbi:Alcohol dehydrogenase transcription factor Myb/SANT-like family protein [Raphanus sativus]|uniref:Trihelix transcription factor ENAP2-like n=1 Tax=Raphanus sativus TaxID=3726 RepID=A0A9W3CU63_RAPSA|nr:trihelix transcription factor ENAP2-like [Raphanus sativus]KAJ4869255.1 Alcohol dehydrogenase transcription factor Myb/SANT-like family protein [Raphanus sativus]
MSDPDSPLEQDPIQDPLPARNQSSPPQPDDAVTDLKIASAPAASASKNSRRLPPPCWSLEETTALIDGYRDKWHALNRGNLKANHWEEVAEAVAGNCPDVTPRKTAVQCRHKMEKLRKRYRTEIQRARSVPVARFVSSWVHFKRMEAMEDRPGSKPGGGEEEREEIYGGGGSVGRTRAMFFNRNGTAGGSSSSGGGGIRIRIPTGVSIAQPGPRFPGKIDPKYTASGSSRLGRVGAGSSYGARGVRIEGGGGKRGREMMMSTEEEEEEEEREECDDPMVEIASAIKQLGDTLLRTEERKMEMTREIEAMRMDMEMKRTKMILESQQRIVEAFAKTMSENLEEKKKKSRRVSSLPNDS